MRCLIFVISLMALGYTARAQADNNLPDVQQVDKRVMFQSQVRELVSYLNEGNESAASQLFREVSKTMEAFVMTTQKAADTATGAEKSKLKSKLSNQVQLFLQFKSFGGNLIRNRNSIDTWTAQFIKTLYL